MTTPVRGLSLETLVRCCCLALPLVILAGALQPALAQSVDEQLQRMQRELTDLQRQVYSAPGASDATSGGATGGAAAGSSLSTTQAARLQVQLNQFESQLEDLTGRVEEMGFKIDDVTKRLDKLVADVDLRLRNLEQGGTQPMASSGAAPMAGQSGQMQSGQMQSGQAMAEGGQMMGEAGQAPVAGQAASPAMAPKTSPAKPGTIGTISETDLSKFQREKDSEAALAQAQGAGTASQAGAAPSAAAAGTQTAEAPAGAGALPAGTPQEQYDYAFGLLRQANYAGAEQAFSDFLTQHPNDTLAGNAKYWLGETYYVRGNYQQAAVTFAEGFKTYPKSSKAPDNLLKLGMSLASLGNTKDACGTYGVLLSRYANAPATILSRAQRESQRLKCK